MSIESMLAWYFGKSAVVLALTALVAVVARREAAAVRHVVWTTGLLATLGLPVWSMVSPSWRVLPVVAAPVVAVAPSADRSDPGSLEGTIAGGAAAPAVVPTAAGPGGSAGWLAPAIAPSAAVEDRSGGGVDFAVAGGASGFLGEWIGSARWGTIALVAWLVGVLVMAARLVAGRIAIGRLARRAIPASSPEWIETIDEVLGGHRSRRPLRFLESAEVTTPCTWGTVRPTVLLPADGAEWPAESRRQVVVHELAHVRRFDGLTQLLTAMVCGIHWFNPLVWLAARSARLAREQCCDDEVLADGGRASAYADVLLAAATTPSARWVPVEALAMARPSQLSDRLVAILDPARRRARVGARWVAGGAAVAIGLGWPLGALSPQAPADPPRRPITAASAPSAPTAPLAPRAPAAPRVPAPAPAAAAAAAAPLVPWETSCRTDPKGKNRKARLSSSVSVTGEGTAHDGDGNVMAAWTGPDCSVAVRTRGRIRFTESEDDVLSISGRGRFEIEHDDGSTTREYLVVPEGAGLARRYRVDGRERPMDDEALAWRRELILEFIRRTGYDAAGRVARIRERRGFAGVIEEIAAIPSDGGRTAYLAAALATNPLSEAEAVQLLERSGSIASDGDLAGLLRSVPEPLLRRRPVFQAYAAAARSIESDGDLANVLMAALRANAIDRSVCEPLLGLVEAIESDGDRTQVLLSAFVGLRENPVCLQRALGLVGEIGSDGDKAQALRGFIKEHGLPAELIETFFVATGSVGSDGDRAAVLRRVWEIRGVSDPVVVAALENARGIGSDGDLAAVLVDAARHRLVRSAAIRAAYLDAARAIGSDGDREAALEAIDGIER